MFVASSSLFISKYVLSKSGFSRTIWLIRCLLERGEVSTCSYLVIAGKLHWLVIYYSCIVEQIPVCTSTFLFGTLDLGIKISEQKSTREEPFSWGGGPCSIIHFVKSRRIYKCIGTSNLFLELHLQERLLISLKDWSAFWGLVNL